MGASQRSNQHPYRIAVRGPVPQNIAALIGQAHAAAILAAPRHSSHDLNARNGSLARQEQAKGGRP